VEAGVACGLVSDETGMTRSAIFLAWIGANVIPSVVVSVLLWSIRGTLGVDRSVVIAYAVLFALVATLQAHVWVRWKAARSEPDVPRRRRWTLSTIVGLVIAMFFGVGTVATLDGLGHEHLGLLMGWAIAGTVLGVAQSAVLGVSRKTRLWWLAASVVGWTGAAATYSSLGTVSVGLRRSSIVRWLIGGLSIDGNIELAITALTFACYGVLTGIVLARLTPRRLGSLS
jgi:hypothetical protein